MKIVVTVDDKDGMMFNKRRQSQDRVLKDRILQLAKGSVLWMNQYTAKQFERADIVRVDEGFLRKAGQGEYCFVEDQSLLSVADQIEEMVILKWNRSYPADRFLDVKPESKGFTCRYMEEFPGSSHEKITMEIWG